MRLFLIMEETMLLCCKISKNKRKIYVILCA